MTTLVDMPLNNVPSTTTGPLLLQKLAASQVCMLLLFAAFSFSICSRKSAEEILEQVWSRSMISNMGLELPCFWIALLYLLHISGELCLPLIMKKWGSGQTVG